ncbi:Uracil-DNA glycosylase [Lentibacillus sp. JNUCC-1]|uniref:uracil-DNA glycosylase n=1 Tax=Lentibacillus sp. JNUCC-1 TaxID=2654513 RepID=UPI0012E8F1D8|nr:uracil-DNA glycosylase [Lentibacillus sp. JNUCC-1]MUV36805.1 Uracil-DNA glycosylase [Lentibacillus sp. JNUCC-1]
MSQEILHNDWAGVLNDEFSKPYYLALREFLKREYAYETVFPEMHDIFNALHLTSFEDVKVVILGQDPYHGLNQAHGLSFSVQPGVKQPPSLVNIFKEMTADLGCSRPETGDLRGWAEQGVLLLNTVLTVRAHNAHSHKGQGWETFTNQVIESLNRKETPVVYILWGRAAQDKKALIDTSKHFIVQSPHPSPLSAHRGFFGSRPFSKTNGILEKQGLSQIQWCSL